jgi:hypothetical protein
MAKDPKIGVLESKIKSLEAANERLEKRVKSSDACVRLNAETLARLQTKIAQLELFDALLESNNLSLEETNLSLKTKNKKLKVIKYTLIERLNIIEVLEAENEKLKQNIHELEQIIQKGYLK